MSLFPFAEDFNIFTPKQIEPLEPLQISVERESSLDELVYRQAQLMDMLGISTQPVADILTAPLFKDVLINMAGEAHEALEPLAAGTKPWKNDREGVRAHVIEEVVDVLFFVLEACILAGMGAKDIERAYLRKWNHIVEKRLGKTEDGNAALQG